MKRTLVVIAISLLFIFLLTNCGETTTLTTTTPSSTATTSVATSEPASTPAGPQSGGILKIITQPGVKNLGVPGEATVTTDGSYSRPCVESLVTFDPRGTDQPIPLLSTGWEISPDYKSITFGLRQGVKFHDGTDFNAEAAKYCLDMIRTGVRTNLKAVESVDIIDDYTIRLNLVDYDPGLLVKMITMGSWMVSPTALETKGVEYCRTHPVGTGPFKFADYQRDVSLKYERFEGYWQEGKPYLDGLEFIFMADPVTSLMSFKKGEAQAINRISPSDGADLKASGGYNFLVCRSQIGGFAGDSAHEDSPFANIKVRQALSYAIDAESISKALGYGFTSVPNQLADPGRPPCNPDVVGYPYNPQKAKELLAEAGYSGLETKLVYLTSSFHNDLFTAVQANLSDIGVKLDLEAAESGRFSQSRDTGWNNSLLQFWVPGSPGFDISEAFTNYLSTKATQYKDIYNPPDYSALLEKAQYERDPEKALQMWKQLQKMAIDDYCLVTIFYGNAMIMATSPDVRDLDMYVYSGHDWHPEKIWLSK